MQKHSASSIWLYDFEPEHKTFRDEVLQGLQRVRKELPSKYFYDEVGSDLFEQICELDEYYPTRTELSIMEAQGHEMAELIGERCLLIEYGSGSSTKTRMLLDVLQDPVGYVPIEISKEALLNSALSLELAYPTLEVLPVCADYTSEFKLPMPRRSPVRRVAYFPGSTIGNFDHPAARGFLRQVAKVCEGGGLLIGVDLKKDFNVLHRAYNDSQGVTAQFNKHILTRINQELEANFQVQHFGHYAFYNPDQSRVEMHLVSLRDQQVCIGEVEISFRLGESIWTESSYKYTFDEFALLAASAGFTVEKVWTDPRTLFSVQYLTVR